MIDFNTVPWRDMCFLVGGLVTGAAGIWFPLQNAISQSKTQRADFFIKFTDRYNSPEMHDALYTVMDFALKNGEAFPAAFASAFNDRTEEGRHLDQARRLITRYFFDVAELISMRLIDTDLARRMINYEGLNIFYLVAIEMTRARYGKTPEREKLIAILKKVRGHYENGLDWSIRVTSM